MRFWVAFFVSVLVCSVFVVSVPSQVDSSVVSLGGRDWSFRVLDGGLEKHGYSVDVVKGKELRYVLSSFTEAEKYTDGLRFPVSYSGLTCYYQPELTEEENKSGAVRPIDVVGSYACFNSSGVKVMHIYRSKLVDAKGNECWLNMKLEKDFLVVFLDFDWLKSAVYPVIVDPTFGYTSKGGSTWSQGNGVNLNRYQAPETGTVTDLSIYLVNVADNAYVRLAIYSDDSGSPDALLGESSSLSVANPYDDWKTATGLSVAVTEDVYYWIGFQIPSALADEKIAYDSSGGTGWERTPYAFGAFPDPVGGGGSNSLKWSVYATYEVGGDVYTLDLSISQPQNITYSNPSIPITLVVSGNDTNQVTTWNMKFSNGSWLYVSNQTYSGHVHQGIEENVTNVLFCGLVVGDSLSHYHEVYFSVYYSDYVAPDTSSGTVIRYYSDWGVFGASVLLSMCFTLLVGVMVLKKRKW